MISANNGTSITTYTYDYRNRLTEVTTGGTVVATYTYNALNQRIGNKDGGTQTWTVYDGTSADANPYADFSGASSGGGSGGAMTERYLSGPGVVDGAVVDQILARTSAGGTTAWYLTDKLGSVRDIVSTSGSDLDHIVYDSFGNIVSESDPSNGDRFKFAGMEYDSTTGQYYDRARSYSAVAGRFMSLDPRGFAAGARNLYGYVGNGPVNGVDPNGETQSAMEAGLASQRAIGQVQADSDLRKAYLADATAALEQNVSDITDIWTDIGPQYQAVQQLTREFNHYNELTMIISMEVVVAASLSVMMATTGVGAPAAIITVGVLEVVGAAVMVWSSYVTNAVGNDLSTATAKLSASVALLRYVKSQTARLQATVARAQKLLVKNSPSG
jgi:RHS repeat-associated protein